MGRLTSGRYLLMVVLLLAVVPIVGYCMFFLTYAVIFGNGVKYSDDTPYFLELMIMPWVIASMSIGVAWLSLRLWSSSTWRFVSFPLALSLYVMAAAVMSVVGLI